MTVMSSALIRRIRSRVSPNENNWLLWVLVPAAAVLIAVEPKTPLTVLQLVDWPTLGALTGLLALTKAVELSGVLQRASRRLVARVPDERRLALLLVTLSAALAAVLTNDVSLFLIVPLTRSLTDLTRLPLSRLVIFEALAVNTGSALTPIGNPQNLFLWQSSGQGFLQFVGMMLPMVLTLSLLLLAATWLLFRRRPLRIRNEGAEDVIDPHLLAISAALFAAFIVLLDLRLIVPGLALVAISYALFRRRVLLEVDWTLLLIIGLMFVDLRQVAALPALERLLHHLPIAHGVNAYLAGVLTSQVISNVPATILLQRYTHDLPALAYGVNVGGYGLLIGSLANLIALRLARQPGSFRLFHLISAPFLILATLAVLGLMRMS